MLTQEVKDDMEKMGGYSVATSSSNGEPNVNVVKMLKVVDDNTVWLVDNYMNKTLANVKENPRASFLVWSSETKGAWQVKGDIKVLSSGEEYEKAKEWAHSVKETLPAKNVLRMTVTDIYNVRSGADAGKRVV